MSSSRHQGLAAVRRWWSARHERRLEADAAKASRAGRLARAVGAPVGAGELEALESRQLLATYTIGPGDIDPATGIGTVFIPPTTYSIPYLFREVPDEQDPDVELEEFSDEMDFWTNFVPAVPPNGTTFMGSNIRIGYATQSNAAVRLLIPPGGGTQQPGDPATDRDLAFDLQVNDRVTLSFFDDGTGADAAPRVATTVRLGVRNGQSDGGPINTNLTTGTRIELLLRGQVVEVLTGNEIDAIAAQSLQGITYTIIFAGGFDAIRFSSAALPPDNGGYFDAFILDDIEVTYPPGRFEQYITEGIFAYEGSFSGRIGASVTITDLYGRPHVPGLLAQGRDVNDDGVPDNNDGIGRITFSNTDEFTNFTLYGGTFEEGSGYELVDSYEGLYDEFEQAGFGYALTNEDTPSATGLPPGPGSLVIGSPIVRPLTSAGGYRDFFQIPEGDDFLRPDQGIFVTGGNSIGSVVIHGILHGSSRFTGAVERLAVGFLPGSVTVDGDLGLLSVGSDAALWEIDPEDDVDTDIFEDPINPTNAQLVVGRTVREIVIAGRSTLDVTILADVNNPNRRVLNFQNYAEREVAYQIPVDIDDPERTVNRATINRNADRSTQNVPFGTGYSRNDSLGSAEFVGYNATQVRITGSLGAVDPWNSAEDQTDVYAFVADATREVVIELSSVASAGLVRVLDRNGRNIASNDLGGPGRGPGGNAGQADIIRFRPDHADIFYLVVNDPPDAGIGIDATYTITISGMAPTTLGAFRTGAGAGGLGDPFVLALSAGNLGAVRIGTGFVGGDASEVDPGDVTNADNSVNIETLLEYRTSTVSVPRNLYHVYTGSEVNGAQLLVGRAFGTLITGQNPAVGSGLTEGDLFNADIRTGDGIAVLDIKGGLGIDQDPDGDDQAENTGGIVNIRTGISGRPGHIGQILVGAYMSGAGLNIQTSNGSRIDQFRVGVGLDTGGTGSLLPPGDIWFGTPVIRMGVGSDLRFADFSLIQRAGSNNVVTVLNFGQTLSFVDDAGATYTVSISGPSNAQSVTSSVELRFLPVDGSLGSALARINGQILGGANLVITGTAPGTVSIGRIVLNTDTNGSRILLGGQAQIDVGRIDILAGQLAAVNNSTTNGDIVAIDATALREIIIATGSLGRTETNGVGPALLGPFFGLGAGRDGGVTTPLGVDEESLNSGTNGQQGDKWNGEIDLGVQIGDWDFPTPLEDLGSPIDGYLDGVVVRGGDLTRVSVGGAVGDVIVEAGDLLELFANADRLTPFGAFHGIVGSVYAVAINRVDVGDGLRPTGPGPFARAGIFADDDIVSVFSSRTSGVVVNGVIIASNNTFAPRTTIGNENPVNLAVAVSGISRVEINNGLIDDTYIGAMNVDAYWVGGLRSGVLDDNEFRGDIDAVAGTNTNLFRSGLEAINVQSVTLFGTGAYDATFINVSDNVFDLVASEFRNTTRLGQPAEFRVNRIEADNDLRSITTTGLTGDIADLIVDVGGSVLGTVSARNIIRFELLADNNVAQLLATNDIRSSSFRVGNLVSVSATGDVRSTTVDVAGPIQSFIIGGEVSQTSFTAFGPDGRIDLIRSTGLLQGTISSTGPIGTIESIQSDVSAFISTSEADARLGVLRAGRDLLINLQLQGDVGTITAGRHIGQFGETTERTLDVRGSLGSIMTPNGQIYTDLLVGQGITGTVMTGRVSARTGNDLVSQAAIIAFGRINLLDFNGDFAGQVTSHSGGIGTVRITNGSLRPGASIIANDGSIDSVFITGGHLQGSITAADDITSVRLTPGTDGFLGHIGIANFLRVDNPFIQNNGERDELRNQLPPNAFRSPGIDGARIHAGRDLLSVVVDGEGSIWESGLSAGRTVGSISASSIRSDALTEAGFAGFITAGDRIDSITARGFVNRLTVVAGLTDFGSDDRPGGKNDAADTVKSGDIGTINFAGRTVKTTFTAGINPGSNGLYNSADDRLVGGFSTIGSITVPTNSERTSAFADGPIGSIVGTVRRFDTNTLAFLDPSRYLFANAGSTLIAAGTPFFFTTPTGESGSVTYTGSGQVYFDSARNAVIFRNTGADTALNVSGGTLTNLRILGNNNARLGSLSVSAQLRGSSSAFVDASLGSAVFSTIDATGLFGSGGNINAFTVNGSLSGGTLEARELSALSITGNYGRSTQTGEAVVRALTAGSIAVGGAVSGIVSVDRVVGAFTAGSFNRGGLRAGRAINAFTSGPMNDSVVSARDSIGSITVNGNVLTTAFLAGGDLGSDAAFGGSGTAADVVTDGTIGPVRINGNFRQSDLAAGLLRGPDGFLGTDDDRADDGRSSIADVVITGNQVGSSLNSQQYRIVSNGTLGTVTVAGLPFSAQANFSVVQIAASPIPVRVVQTAISEDSRVYSFDITFNQPIDSSTLSAALSVLEVRSGGQSVGLAEGTDYTVRYRSSNRTATITFSRNVSQRDLPQQLGVAGPGLYRFVLAANILRGQTQTAQLDGNGDGIPGDDFSIDDFIGDVGDKAVAGNPTSDPSIDFYGPGDLNLFLDSNSDSDDLPDVNTVFTLRGSIGDHPDSNADTFRTGGDVDLYRVNLRAGQIVRLGSVQGVAQLVTRAFYDAAGNFLVGNQGFGGNFDGGFTGVIDGGQFGGESGPMLRLANNPSRDVNLSSESQYLVTVTGEYYLGVGGALGQLDIFDIDQVRNIAPLPGTIGAYNFTITIFDDGDTGFAGDTDSGDGALVVNAPTPITFAGADGVFGNSDDITAFTTGTYTFTLDRGPDGQPNTRDDTVSGTSTRGFVSTRTAGRDGRFGTVDDVVLTTIRTAIGEPGAAGVPLTISPDADVYRLNGGQAIEAGTRIRATVRLTETGANIGLTGTETQRGLRDFDFFALPQDLRGEVQFGLFEVPTGGGFDSGRLVASATDFLPIGGQDPTTLSNVKNSYGYDDQGDFFFEFLVPGAQGVSGLIPAAYAIMIQGAVRSDYTLEILTRGRGTVNTQSQNVLIETRGGSIDWLESGDGLVTAIDPFTTETLGFSGQFAGLDADEYVLQNLIDRLNTLFTANNANVIISTEAADFEGQDFSTVFLAGNVEPNAFFNNGTFGASQKSDPFNVDLNDQAVVFIPSLGTLGSEPTQAGVDSLVASLTAAVSRRIGELVGLRLSANATGTPLDPTANNSVFAADGGTTILFTNTDSPLSFRFDETTDTNFFFGRINSGGLLNRIISPRA